jgi:hypothetical protein
MKAFLRTGLLLLPALMLGLLPVSSPAQFGIAVNISTAPPPLPEYSQPPCPDPGYLWEPGYWAWSSDGYYWVPGVWVEPPQPGLFWTPGYWAFENGDYRWNDGYWGPQVGFYGGVDYGFGYPGEGFYGGMWQGRAFRYNTAYWHVDRDRIHDFYERRENFHENHDRASFNGRGGIQARPTPQDERAMRAHHFQPTPRQLQHRDTASRNPQYQYKANHGRPQHAAMTRVGNQQRPGQNRRPNGVRPNNAHPNNAHPNSARPNHARPNNARPNNARPNNARPNNARPNNARPNNARPNNARPANPRPNNGRQNKLPAAHPQRPEARHPAPPARPQRQPKPQNHPAPRPQNHPRPQARPQNHPAARPESHPQGHPAAHPKSRPKEPEKPHSQS